MALCAWNVQDRSPTGPGGGTVVLGLEWGQGVAASELGVSFSERRKRSGIR